MVAIQHIRGIGAVLAGLAGALVLFGATPAFGSQTPGADVPGSVPAALGLVHTIVAAVRLAGSQSDCCRGGGVRSPDRNATPRVAVSRQIGRIKSST
jgi:hypothetical protein